MLSVCAWAARRRRRFGRSGRSPSALRSRLIRHSVAARIRLRLVLVGLSPAFWQLWLAAALWPRSPAANADVPVALAKAMAHTVARAERPSRRRGAMRPYRQLRARSQALQVGFGRMSNFLRVASLTPTENQPERADRCDVRAVSHNPHRKRATRWDTVGLREGDDDAYQVDNTFHSCDRIDGAVWGAGCVSGARERGRRHDLQRQQRLDQAFTGS